MDLFLSTTLVLCLYPQYISKEDPLIIKIQKIKVLCIPKHDFSHGKLDQICKEIISGLPMGAELPLARCNHLKDKLDHMSFGSFH